MMRIYVAIIFLYFSSTSFSQPYIDLGSFQGLTGNSDKILTDKHSIKTSWFASQLTYPLQFKDSSILVSTVGYENYEVTLDESINLRTGYLALTYLIPLKKNWKISFTAIPRFNSEREDVINKDAFQMGGAVITSKKYSEKLTLKAGLYYNKEFFGNYFLPLIGGQWKASDRLVIFGLLPNNLLADYRISPIVHAGFIYKGITASFRLKENNPYDYFRIEEGQLKLFTDVYLIKNLVLNIEAGHTLARKYGPGFLNEKENKLRIDEGYFFKAGIYYRLWI